MFISSIKYRVRLIQFITKKKVRTAALLLIVLFHLTQYGIWIFNKEHILYETSRDLGNFLPPESILAGEWAPALGVENKLKTIRVDFQDGENADRLQDIQPTHFIWIDSLASPNQAVKEKYPDLLQPRDKVWEKNIGWFTMSLYQLHWPNND